jgi:2-C-methyl-D-erythritol 2,4-cyclodiphosphate synthase
MIRIGTGFDVHAFCEGNTLVLGGVNIPFNKSFAAHSDGDVLIHSICDALYGSLALGDIGKYFPPEDSQWKGCSSDVFLKHAIKLIGENNYIVENIDTTIICEKPKIKPHISSIQSHLAKIMTLEPHQISVKATTTEKLGFCGREEGIAVQSVCLIKQTSSLIKKVY